MSGRDGRGGRGGIGHRVIAGPGRGEGQVGQGFHLEPVIRTAGEKPGGGNGRGGKVFRDKEDDRKRLLHHPVAVDEKAAGHEAEEAGEEDDLVADAGGHGFGKFSVFSFQCSAGQ